MATMKQFLSVLAACFSLCAVVALGGCAAESGPSSSSANAAASSAAATDATAASSADATSATSTSSDAPSEAAASSPASSASEAASEEGAAPAASDLADGDYAIETKTDSSMFHPVSCTLHVQGGAYSATITMPGEGFSRLFFGTAEEAAAADEANIYDYYLGDDGKYTFDVPVAALDEELAIAAWGQRRDTWYDHTIIFHSPGSEQAAAA